MALFSRVTVWVSNQVLTAAALNGEFNNILNNAMASSWIGFSANVPQMQQQANPGGVGTESLAGSISDEIQRLRYMLAFVLGQPSGLWYDHTGRNLGAGNLAVQTADIANNAITTAKILDEAVTAAKIAPGVITPFPLYFFNGYYASSNANYWQTSATGSYTNLSIVGTIPALSTITNVGFGFPSIPTGNLPGITFTAPTTGIIEFEVGFMTATASAQQFNLRLYDTVSSSLIGYAIAVQANFDWVTVTGFLNVTGSTVYNVLVQAYVNTSTANIQSLANGSAMLVVKMKYVKGA